MIFEEQVKLNLQSYKTEKTLQTLNSIFSGNSKL